nr:secreted RxLR effector protein 161-like [Nicotiana tomentosiformis]
MSSAKAICTPIGPSTSLDKDEKGNPVDKTKYHGIISSFFYLNASRPDIMFSVCKCARFQSAPKESHLTAVKRIIRYFIGTILYGLWYPHSNNFKLEDFSDADLAGDKEDRKSTSGACQLLGKILISWNSKKQGSVALSTTEAKYIAIGQCYAQLLCMSHQLEILLQKFSMAKHSKNPSASTRKTTRSKEKPSSQLPEQVDLGSDHSEWFASS